MEERGLNRVQLARELGIAHTTLCGYLLDKHAPAYPVFVKLLYQFDCSADYLLGKDGLHTEERLLPVPPFHERLRCLLNEQGVSQERLKRELPVSGSVLYKWTSGKSQPSPETLLRLAEYLDCSVDYLIGRRR